MKLKPCPFCGTDRTELREGVFGAVIVCECGARGPYGGGESKIPMACDLWNRRKLPPNMERLLVRLKNLNARIKKGEFNMKAVVEGGK